MILVGLGSMRFYRLFFGRLSGRFLLRILRGSLGLVGILCRRWLWFSRMLAFRRFFASWRFVALTLGLFWNNQFEVIHSWCISSGCSNISNRFGSNGGVTRIDDRIRLAWDSRQEIAWIIPLPIDNDLKMYVATRRISCRTAERNQLTLFNHVTDFGNQF